MDNTMENLNIIITADVKSALSGLSSINSQLSKLGTTSGASATQSINTVTSTAKSGTGSIIAGLSKLTIVVQTLRQAFKYLGKSIEESMDYGETINLFQTSMRALGKKAGSEFAFLDRAETFSSNIAENIGLDPDMLMNYQAVFAQMTSSMGVTESAAYDLSESFTMLGADISSLFNIDVETAYKKLQSALSGQTRGLRELGVDISVATMQEKALALGITKSVSAMTQAEKTQLRYIMIMEGLTVAQGDMARTLESPANQLRILSAQFVQLTRAIGNIFLPAVTAVLPYINAVVMGIKNILESLAALVGYEIPDFKYTPVEIFDSDDAAGDVDTVTDSVKKLKKATIGMDELNILSNNSDTASSGAAGGSSIDLSSQIAEMNAAYKEMVDSITNQIGSKTTDILDGWRNFFKDFDAVDIDWDAIKAGLDKVNAAVKPFAKKVGEGLKWFWNEVIEPISEWTFNEALPKWLDTVSIEIGILDTVLEGAWGLIKQFWTDFLQPIAEYTGAKFIDFWAKFNEKLSAVKSQLENSQVFTDLQTILGAIYDVLEPIVEALADFVFWVADFTMNTAFIDLQYALEDIEDFIGSIAALIRGDFDDAWSHLTDLFVNNRINEFNDKMEEMKSKFNDVKQTIGEWKDAAVEAFTNFINSWKEKISNWWESDVKPWFTKEKWEEILFNIGAALGNALNKFVEFWTVTIPNWWNEDVAPWFTLEKWKTLFSNIKTALVSKITETFASWSSSISNWWRNDVAPWFTVAKWKELGTNIKNGIIGGFKGAVNGVVNILNNIIGSFEKLINGVVDGINAMIKGFNSVSVVDIGLLGHWSAPRIPVPFTGYATGGIPNYGELFMAREGGITEMVGSFGNHTGVANNEQIVQGIASGVADANMEQNAILREQNGLLRRLLEKDTTVSAVLSTTEIIGGISRKNRRDGKTIIPVGV